MNLPGRPGRPAVLKASRGALATARIIIIAIMVPITVVKRVRIKMVYMSITTPRVIVPGRPENWHGRAAAGCGLASRHS